ncbi:MAG: glycosyltransferase [Phycisphaerales bacterium]|nr:glycogen synthase [Planctomycetota bacterium]
MADQAPSLPLTADEGDASRQSEGASLFEIAWEVCNQLGGIYQVIRSKVPLMMERWGDRYTLIGPYNEQKASVEFEPTAPGGWIGRAIEHLAAQGLKVHHGRWLVPGRPRVLLIEHGVPGWRLGEIKYGLWEHHGIETPGSDWLIDGVVTFSDAVRRVLEALCEQRASAGGVRAAKTSPRVMIAHFHEWMAGLAIPMIRRQNLPVATVFTTHATLLGRFMAMGMDDFYERLHSVNDAEAARKYNIVTQHKIERACAHGAHVFSTVSAVTAEECSALLGRPVDVVLPNGLNVARYNLAHEQQQLHANYKDRIHQFTMGHFFPSYSFDLDKTLYLFTSGRYEPRNKGFDLCLEALARLNMELKAHRVDKTVVFFIVTSKPTKSLNPLALEKRGVMNELRTVCQNITQGVEGKLYSRAAAGGKLRLDDLVDEYWTLRYRRTQQAMKQHCLPMVVTHILENDSEDPVLSQIRYLGLINRPEDPVKIVYHPEFISPANPLWGIEYDQFVRGCHMGLFPSSYEPWGYTPLECIAMGVPSVTSDLAGFGRYVSEHHLGHDEWGLTVLRRRGRSYNDAAAELCAKLLDFCRMDRRERIALRNAVDRRSWDFDWQHLGPAYHEAHDMAVERFFASGGSGLGALLGAGT